MSITIYQYPNCGSCKKAIKWLDKHDVDYQSIHIVESTPSKDQLKDFWERSELPIKNFFNTSGGSYRSGNFKDKLPNMSDDEKLDALAADGMLIKRPILDAGDAVLVGFKADKYEECLGEA